MTSVKNNLFAWLGCADGVSSVSSKSHEYMFDLTATYDADAVQIFTGVILPTTHQERALLHISSEQRDMLSPRDQSGLKAKFSPRSRPQKPRRGQML